MPRAHIFVALPVLGFAMLLHAETGRSRTCNALEHRTIPAESIGLPTTGAVVTSAHHHGDFCKLLGRIHPVDPAADDIRFELNLPNAWNGKALQYGGGTFDGYLAAADGRGVTPVSVHSQPTPLARGYATFGSDGGHHTNYFPLPDAINAINAKFARNEEMRRNFAGDQLKKVHDTAAFLIAAHYGHVPARMYFIGASTGGREALRVAQRYPADYDGVLAAYAAWNSVELDMEFIRTAQALYAPGGFLGHAQTRYIVRTVRNACDAGDGLSDGIISNPAGCHIDPAILACSEKHGPHGCLNSAQLHTLEAFAETHHTSVPLSNGVNSVPGYNVLAGADLGGVVGVLHVPLHHPVFLLNSFGYIIGDDILRNYTTVGSHYNALHFDVNTLSPVHDQVLRDAAEIDATDADLRPFFAHGGKLILVHGTVDTIVPTNSSVDYFQRLQSAVGVDATAASARLYLVPGFGHGFGSFNGGFDTIGTLDDWADRNIAPANLIVTDNNRRNHGRTRPLCEWPAFPQFADSGDRNSASSFRCVNPSGDSPHDASATLGDEHKRG